MPFAKTQDKPFLKVIRSLILDHRKTHHLSLITNHWRRRRAGFGLIEILLSVVLIIAIVTALFASSGTFLIRRGSDLQSIASKIASKDIETLRGQSFSSLPAAGTYTCVIVDTDLSKLGSGACGDRTVANYTGDANIKQITVTIRWQQSGKSKSLVMDTLIYTNGL